jgi:hypothetical protein
VAFTRTLLGYNSDKATTSLNVPNAATSAGDIIVGILASDSIVVGSTNSLWDPTGGSGGTNPDYIFSVTNSGHVVLSYAIWQNVGAATAGKVTVGGSGSGESMALIVIKISGCATSDIIDRTSSATGQGKSLASGATAFTQWDDEYLIGATAMEGPVDDFAGDWQNSFTRGNRFGTGGQGATSNVTVDEGYRIVSTKNNYEAAVVTAGLARYWAAFIVTIKAGGPTPIRRTQSLLTFAALNRSRTY